MGKEHIALAFVDEFQQYNLGRNIDYLNYA